MRGATLTIATDFVVEECCACGVAFAMTAAFKKECLNNRGRNGRLFYCPNGHGQHYNGESDADKYRREAERLHQQIAQRDDELASKDRQIVAAKGQMTKLKKRTANGVCPCCTRSFVNLRRHIETKHPDFGTDNVVALKEIGGTRGQ